MRMHHKKKFNKFCNLSNGTTIVELTQGQWCILVTVFWEKIKHLKWCAHWCRHTKTFYVISGNIVNGKVITTRMHNLIKPNYEDDKVVDHINGDTLDNRTKNLQIITKSRNRLKSKKQSHYRGNECSSQVSGVALRKDSNKWRSYIIIDDIRYNLGNFITEQEAIDARNKAYNNYWNHEILP